MGTGTEFGLNRKEVKMPQYVILFVSEKGWEKAFTSDEKEKETLLHLKSAFLKRWYIDQRPGNAIYESLEEAEKNKQPGEEVRVMAPPENILKSMKHEEVVFYYADELPPRYPHGVPDGEIIVGPQGVVEKEPEEEEIFTGPQGISDEEFNKLPIAEEDMTTDITEEDAMPLGDGEDTPEK